MDNPDYGTISDIDPDGGGDYTTLQAWYEDTYDEAAIQHARCHHGDAAGLGTLDTSTQNWAYTPTADEPVCIYAAEGDEADGSQDDELQGAAVVSAVAMQHCLSVNWYFVKIQGLRLTAKEVLLAGVYVNLPGHVSKPLRGTTIERCVVVRDHPFDRMSVGFLLNISSSTYSATVRNNLILSKDSTKDCVGIYVLSRLENAACDVLIDANSIINCATEVDGFPSGGIGGEALTADDILDIVARNNVVADDGTPSGDSFAEYGLGVVDWSGSSHNVSSDATADTVVGGSDNIINAAIGDVWADIGDGNTPFAPKIGGELDPPDGVNLYDAGIVEDGIGQPRTAMPNHSHYRGGITLWRQCPDIFRRQVIGRGVG